jgi:hypothetical protein
MDLGFGEAAPAKATSHLSDGITLFGGSVMPYRYEATSVAGFVQQLAVAYIANGYYFYVAGRIPDHKDPTKTDQKILEQYGIAVSKWARARRKREGLANVHYLRYNRVYVIIATHGVHPFFAAEANRLRDIRRHPISFMGYSIGCRRARGGGAYHASVRIDYDRFAELKSRFEVAAPHLSVEELCSALGRLEFEPYAPVRAQFCGLLRAVNRGRKLAGLELVPREALRLDRSSVRPFAQVNNSDGRNARAKKAARPIL